MSELINFYSPWNHQKNTKVKFGDNPWYVLHKVKVKLMRLRRCWLRALQIEKIHIDCQYDKPSSIISNITKMSFDSFLKRTRKFSKMLTVTSSIPIVSYLFDFPQNGCSLNCLLTHFRPMFRLRRNQVVRFY